MKINIKILVIKKYFTIMMIIMPSLSTIQCANVHEENISGTNVQTNNNCIGVERSFLDLQNDVNEEVVDLTELKVIIGTDCIEASISVSNLPQKLTFNHSTLPDNVLNYKWEVSFDVDNDGIESTGDFSLSVSKFKFPGQVQEDLEILSTTQVSIFEIVEGGSGSNIGDAIGTISGNSFKLYASKLSNSSIEKVQSSTPIKFSAVFYDGGKHFTDYYPDDLSFQ
ncbi:MAG: hypothetical protein OCD76_12030 [Reichenbachiella sp.]